jgi:aldehyde dehydrogenase (NAD+)
MQTKLYIDGELTDGLAGRTIEVNNPADGTVLATVAEAGSEDVDRAVTAASRAFPRWAARPAAERGRLLMALADAIEGHAEELARLESLDTGHPIRDTTVLDVPRTAAAFRYFGGIADKHQGSVIPVEQGSLTTSCPSRSEWSARSCRGTSR